MGIEKMGFKSINVLAAIEVLHQSPIQYLIVTRFLYQNDLLHLFEFHSIKSSSYDNRNANSTGTYWLIKVFEVLKGIQDDVVLDGRVYLDETYFSKIKSDNITINGKKLRGISKNKIGVAVATNLTSSIFIVTGTSKPSEKSTLSAYGKHIKKRFHYCS